MALPDGLYDLLLTEGLARSLAVLDPGSVELLLSTPQGYSQLS